MTSSFIAELVRRLQGQGPALALPLTGLEQRLAETGSTINQLVGFENQRQATDQVSISNSIASLRFLDATDWREFVESMSVVESALRGDPAGAYGGMSFATRDHYRHVVEKIANRSKAFERDVAVRAVQLAEETLRGGDRRAGHVGFYLIGDGRETLERLMAMRGSRRLSLRRAARRQPLPLYSGVTVAAAALFTWGLIVKAHAPAV